MSFFGRARFLPSHPRFWTFHTSRHTIGLRLSAPRSSLPVYFGVAALGLGLSARSTVYCEGKVGSETPLSTTDAPAPVLPASPADDEIPPPPKSSVSMYELSFGTISGICAGVFLKKGAKTVAFVLGGIFVLLQYLGSLSYIRVDWKRIGTKFEDSFYSADAQGVKHPPSVYSVWSRLVHFLTADFQPRASFLAGLILGLRIG